MHTSVLLLSSKLYEKLYPILYFEKCNSLEFLKDELFFLSGVKLNINHSEFNYILSDTDSRADSGDNMSCLDFVNSLVILK